MGPTAREQGYEHCHDDRGASDEDPGDGRFGAALGGEHREVEADHPDGRKQGEPPPSTAGEVAQRSRAAPAEERQQKQAGEGVAEELAARVRVVAQDAVGGEGGADEDAGEGGRQGPSDRVRVHGPDARESGGPD